MNAIESINALAERWATTALAGLVGASLLLVAVTLVWLAVRHRASASLGAALFLLVVLKPLVPVELALPVLPAPEAPPVSQPVTALPAATVVEMPAAAATLPPLPPPSFSLESALFLTWATVSAVLLLTLAFNQLRLARWCRRGTHAGDHQPEIDALAATAGTRPPRVLLHPAATTPFVCGLLRPKLVLPENFFAALDADQRRWVLLHEIAHLRRRDLWTLMLQRIAKGLFFFNPAVWLASRQVDRLREFACDDFALANAQTDPHTCGESFLAVIKNASEPALPGAAALALSESTASYRTRLQRLVDTARKPVPAASPTGFAALALVAAAALPTLVAQDPETTSDEPGSTASADAGGDATDPADAGSASGSAAGDDTVDVSTAPGAPTTDDPEEDPGVSDFTGFGPAPAADSASDTTAAAPTGGGFGPAVADEPTPGAGVSAGSVLAGPGQPGLPPFTITLGVKGALHTSPVAATADPALAIAVNNDGLVQQLDDLQKRHPERRIVIRAVTDTPYDRVKNILDLCSKRGFHNVSFSTGNTRNAPARSSAGATGNPAGWRVSRTRSTLSNVQPATPGTTTSLGGSGTVRATPAGASGTGATTSAGRPPHPFLATPRTAYNLSSPVAAAVVKVHAKPRSQVKRGEVLLTLDPTDAEAALKIALARVEEAKAELVVQETIHDGAHQKMVEVSRLAKSNAVSQSEIGAAKREVDTARAMTAKAQASLNIATAQLSQQENYLSRHTVRAPADGLVVHTLVHPGQTVTVGTPVVLFSTAATGSPKGNSQTTGR